MRQIQVRAIEAILEHKSFGLDFKPNRAASEENIEQKPGVLLDLMPPVGDDFGAKAADGVEGFQGFLGSRGCDAEMADGPGRDERDVLPWDRDGAAQRVIDQERLRV